jgi:predicted naringenin-chalcone synthase
VLQSGGSGGGAVETPTPALAPQLRPHPRAARGGARGGPRIAALSVSDSQQTLSQDEVLERLGLRGDEFAEGIYARCGVKRRHLNLSEELLAQALQDRTEQVERELLTRSIEAVDALAIDPLRVGTVVSASLYSLGCPSLAHRLVEHYAMDAATDKYHLTGVGCASGVPLMRLAGQSLREHPEKGTLVVAAESMSGILTRARPGDPRAKVVGSAIFGDGCAAALLSSDPDAPGPTILASKVHQIPGTLDAVSLQCADGDSHLHLAYELPYIAGEALGEVVDGFLQSNGVAREEIDHWIVHPGGRRIIENVQAALGLSDEDARLSWEALADHGNVGTPSIYYVLASTIERRAPEPGEHGLIVTIGPGVTAGLMLLGW